MKTRLILFIMIGIIGCSSAQVVNNITVDERSGKPMLIGLCTSEILIADTSFSWWFESEYDNYEPEDSSIKEINLKDVQIVIVMGTWCGDTRKQLPRFLKILDQVSFDLKNLTMYAVDRKKKAEGIDIDYYVIERVPTFIFYKNDSELGRIIETPKASLEADMIEILSGSQQ
ncbi:MAG: thioredoxin family protein [Bacteroidetes bacterium]|nr:thioredoxin family protein [Bacteroidota bacterium]